MGWVRRQDPIFVLPFCRVNLHANKPKDSQYPVELRTLVDHIRSCRLDRGLTQRQVAEILGIDISAVEGWEQRRCIPIEPRIPAIISFLGYNLLPQGTTLGERLWFCRLSLGLPATVLGERLGMDGMSIRRWEDGLYSPRKWNQEIIERFIADHEYLFIGGHPDGSTVDPNSCGKKSAYRKRSTPTRSQN